MKTLELVTHPTKPEAREAEKLLRELAPAVGIEVSDESVPAPELVMALGGDGTILRAARRAHEKDLPLLGVNVGRLGFLSALEASNLEPALRLIARDELRVENRLMLEAGGFSGNDRLKALNEIVVEKSVPARVIRIHVDVERQSLATFTADAFIVATPSGSTAYSFSAGGPILEPEMEALILTPVSTHSPLWKSSLVVKADRSVELEVEEGSANLSADGEPSASLEMGVRMWVRKHARPLRLIELELPGGAGFFGKLRSRLGVR